MREQSQTIIRDETRHFIRVDRYKKTRRTE
jgi:hypothetical protein